MPVDFGNKSFKSGVRCSFRIKCMFVDLSYFIPEDGDEELFPNVFLAPKPRQPGTPPTLGQVKNAFPLPGHYHFRFKSPLYPGGDRDKGAMAVWMDVVKDSAPIPTWKNGIVAKVTRLSAEDDEDDDDEDFGVSTPASAPVPSNTSAPSTSSDHLDLFNGPAPAPAAAPPAATPNLFDAHPAPAPASTGGSNLLDFGSGTAAPAPSAHADFLGMTAPVPAPTPPQQQAYNPNMYQTTPPQQQSQPQQQANAFNNFASQQGPFGGLGTPWK